MRRSRIYIDQTLSGGALFTLTGEQAHYLSKVLRIRPGDAVALFNGQNGEYHGEIKTVRKHDVEISLEASPTHAPEALLPVHLGLGLSRGERMDYAVQKATELGVTEITPLFTEFSEVKLSPDRAEKRTRHWQKIAINACEQSGRCTVPSIHLPISLQDWLGRVSGTQAYLLDPEGSPGFPAESDGAADRQPIFLLIGPEGGISTPEKEFALQQGFQPIRLGPRILRTETAPVVALTALQLAQGDFR